MHRYWRVLMNRTNANGRAALKKLEMRALVGGVDQCIGGTPITSGTSSGTTAAAAFDANAATEWQSEISSSEGFSWIGYDFGGVIDVLEITLTLGANSSMLSSAAYLSYSDDGNNWTLLAPFVNLTSYGAGATVTINGFAALGNSVVVGSTIALNPGWPAQALNAQVRGEVSRFDIEDSGAYHIAGVTRKESAPDVFVVYPYRRVRLLERQTGRLIREMWSDPVTGAYAFEKLKLREYILLTDDHARFYNAVAADAIVPVL